MGGTVRVRMHVVMAAMFVLMSMSVVVFVRLAGVIRSRIFVDIICAHFMPPFAHFLRGNFIKYCGFLHYLQPYIGDIKKADIMYQKNTKTKSE